MSRPDQTQENRYYTYNEHYKGEHRFVYIKSPTQVTFDNTDGMSEDAKQMLLHRALVNYGVFITKSKGRVRNPSGKCAARGCQDQKYINRLCDRGTDSPKSEARSFADELNDMDAELNKRMERFGNPLYYPKGELVRFTDNEDNLTNAIGIIEKLIDVCYLCSEDNKWHKTLIEEILGRGVSVKHWLERERGKE